MTILPIRVHYFSVAMLLSNLFITLHVCKIMIKPMKRLITYIVESWQEEAIETLLPIKQNLA